VAARGKKPVVRELPAFIEPMLAKPADPFDSDEHLFEVKWDGTRAMCFVGAGGVRLMNRRRRDITFRYPDLACLKNLPKGTILDGEIVVLRPDGSPDFAALQIRDQCEAARKIKAAARSHPAAYIVFDQLYDRYRNVMDRTLLDRRERARATVARCGDNRIVMSEGVTGRGVAYYDAAVERGLEGVVAKRLDSQYFPGKRTDCWLKMKRCETITAVVVGFIPEGSRDFGALIVATEINGALASVGKVGSGFTERVRRQINDFLWTHLRETPVVPSRTRGTWVEPKLYCLVRYMERTPGGQLRAPVFGGLHGGPDQRWKERRRPSK
jgi:bifunctional non-homologous end joining protein LigD